MRREYGKPGQPCGPDVGTYCENGLICSTDLVCVVICCSADECEDGQVCEAPSVGVSGRHHDGGV